MSVHDLNQSNLQVQKGDRSLGKIMQLLVRRPLIALQYNIGSFISNQYNITPSDLVLPATCFSIFNV